MSQYAHIDVILHVGFDADDMDNDTSMGAFNEGSIDPFDFVYSNLPDNTHILKQEIGRAHV